MTQFILTSLCSQMKYLLVTTEGTMFYHVDSQIQYILYLLVIYCSVSSQRAQ